MANKEGKQRIYGLDLFRVISVFVVFVFHSRMHLGCNYGYLDDFVSMGAIFMTAFFLLSGYVLYFASGKLRCNEGVVTFYKKRIIGLIPAYWGIGLLFTIYTATAYYALMPEKFWCFIKDSIILLPIETLALQSVYSTLFPYSHNSGTWFVSCLIFCYAAFPLLKEITKELSQRARIILVFIIGFVVLYSSLLPYLFEVEDIYTNIIVRLAEFTIGVLLASTAYSNKLRIILCNWFAFLLELLLLILAVTVALCLGLPRDYMLYSWIALPLFVFMIITLSCIKENRILESKALSYASEISYMFFFAQFFVWKPLLFGMQFLGLYESNILKIVFSFVLCTIIAVVLHEWMEKPVKKLARRFFFKTK